MYELNGELFESEIDFLDAAKQEYRTGDQRLVADTLEQYGFDIHDIGI